MHYDCNNGGLNETNLLFPIRFRNYVTFFSNFLTNVVIWVLLQAVVNYGAPWWVSLLFQIVHIVQVSTHRAHESCMIFQKWILEWENSRWFLGVSIAGLHSEHLTKQLSHNLSQAILASAQKLLLQQEGRSLSLLIWYHLCEGVMYVSICCLRFATWATSMLQHCLSTQMWTSVMKLQEMCATPQPSASIAMVRR